MDSVTRDLLNKKEAVESNKGEIKEQQGRLKEIMETLENEYGIGSLKELSKAMIKAEKSGRKLTKAFNELVDELGNNYEWDN